MRHYFAPIITFFRPIIISGILGLVFLLGVAIYSLVTPGKWYHGEFNSTTELKNLRNFIGFIPIQGQGRWIKRHYNNYTFYCLIGKTDQKNLMRLQEQSYALGKHSFVVQSFFDLIKEPAQQHPDWQIVLPANINTVSGMTFFLPHPNSNIRHALIEIFCLQNTVWVNLRVNYAPEKLPLGLRLGTPWGEPPGI